MTEQWLPIAEYVGVYEVSSLGRVRSLTRIVQGKWPRRIPTKILRLTKHNKGYRCVTLYRDGRPNKQLVHHLVLEAFVGPRPPDKEGCHGDRDRTHNDVENLRWGTRSDNMQDAVRHGTHNRLAANRTGRRTGPKRGAPRKRLAA
jgi:transcriptional regulator of met regulon